MDKPIRSVIAHSHSYPAASDCALYIRKEFHLLRYTLFAVEAEQCDGFTMWRLLVCCDLDRIKGEIDIDYTNGVVAVARAFITGRGGMSFRHDGVTV